MDSHLHEVLQNAQPGKYILPFFWLHGESREGLLEELHAIKDAGITEFCLESRTHEAFGTEAWFADFQFFMEAARYHGMRVWLLDDKHFPTGYANRYIADHPELRMVSMRMEYRDLSGPVEDGALLPVTLDADEEFLSVTVWKRSEDGLSLTGEPIDLLPALADGLLWVTLPKGYYRVCYVIRTHRTVPGKECYINMLSPESCKAMIHAVYQPHYDRFAEYFGNTFAGFFSDEPNFGNEKFNHTPGIGTLGRDGILLPYADEFLPHLAGELGLSEAETLLILPVLWQDAVGKTAPIREGYMEAATKAYSRNFSWMLGDWCREHGVEYIGHVIEDNDVHQRLALSAGHFFRALDGQDMAGIDIVLHQVIPAYHTMPHTMLSSWQTVVEPSFYRDLLPKLAASHAHIQPLKKGRAMCEVFGAFGWVEGVPEMKYIADLMLCGGINHFVPHAFSPKYPDPDCPPHFHGKGHFTQADAFRNLMTYMARSAHLLSDGVHQAGVAVYYNAEAEWAGGNRMLQREVAQKLARYQVDFDLIPQDVLCGSVTVLDGKLHCNQEAYRALIVPYSQYLPDRVIDALDSLSKAGLPVWFVDDLPEASSGYVPIGDRLAECGAVPLAELGEFADALGLNTISVADYAPRLRVFHTLREGAHTFMLWNEDTEETLDTTVEFPGLGEVRFYDAWRGQLTCPQVNEDGIRLKLAPGETIFLLDGEDLPNCPPHLYDLPPMRPLGAEFKISLRGVTESEFTPAPELTLGNLAKTLSRFSGTIRYEGEFEATGEETILSLGKVFETAEVILNGESLGILAGEPFTYRLDLGAWGLMPGKNRLTSDVKPNLAYAHRDNFSEFLFFPPTGLLGPVEIG